uniref:RING-type E3 ubiquitin transferase n=1 Tax=Kalanchoe fedtschenkoi TaxID=63787 RepID=A0A7N0TWN6_KALFE
MVRGSTRIEEEDEHVPTPTTAIAINKDKNSQQAVRWAVDNLINKKHSCILIHVRTQSLNILDPTPVPKEGRPPTEVEMHQFFLPYRGFCARKGIQAKEVVIHDIEVSSALIDYININNISNIVVGASTRNALMKKFKNPDVATSLTKSAPDFCTVYVIAKGKVQSSRLATQPITPSALSLEFSSQTPKYVTDNLEIESNRSSAPIWGSETSGRSIESLMNLNSRDKFSNSRISMEYPDPYERTMKSSYILESHSGFSSASSSADSPERQSFRSADMSFTSYGSESSSASFAALTPSDMDNEMRRLKLELRQTMDKYNTSYRDADTMQKNAANHARSVTEARMLEDTKHTRGMSVPRMNLEWHTENPLGGSDKGKTSEMKELEELKLMVNALPKDIQYQRYAIEDLQLATDHFADALKVGEGGYGPVYKATLDEKMVAIKILKSDISQGVKQFQQEVEVLGRMRHPNMVLLVGACPEYGCLVYEYMENGSLEDRLFRKDNTPPLSWQARFRIAAEISTALLYLHQAKPEPLVHRDLKPANILLDHNFVGKISDVGLARLVPASISNVTTQYHMTAAAGTFCYIDPEYQQTGMLGTKSDVYSLGVMLLQIITARSPMGLTHQIERAIETGTFEKMLDPLVTDWPVEEALSFAKLALRCCELRKKDRPDLASEIVPEMNRLKNIGMGIVDGLSSSTQNSASIPCSSLPSSNSTN